MRGSSSTLILAGTLAGCSFLGGVDDLQDGASSGGGVASGTVTAGGNPSTASSNATGPGDGGSGAGGPGGGGASGPGAGGGGGDARCPDDMVLAEDAELEVAFCIDRTEVTLARYVAFLLAVGDDSRLVQPAECEANVELSDPTPGCPDFNTASELPATCIDWCDARAYCDWAGKRLCGRIGGGPLETLDAPVPQEEWHFACSGGLRTAYPYGDEPEVGACNIPLENTPDDISDDNTRVPVGSLPTCEGGFDGMFDMQGNASEWVDWCGPDPGGSTEDVCRVRGGHTYGSAEYWRCDNLDEVSLRSAIKLEVGTRCCADAAAP